MLQHLIESNVTFTPRVGSSVVSTVAHVVLISGAIALTATSRIKQIEVVDSRVHFLAPAVVPSTPLLRNASQRANASIARSAVSDAPPLIVAPQINVGIPDIDLSRAPTNSTDFSAGSRVASGNFGLGLGAPLDGGNVLSREQVERAVVLAPGTPMPAFPEQLRSAGLSGAVTLEFVVDTLGRIESESVRVLQSDHEQFTLSVRAVLLRLRFIPAEAQGRKVRQLVRLPFRFDVH